MVGSIFGATGGTFLPRNDKAYVLLSAGWMKGSQWIEWSYHYAFETQWNILLTCLILLVIPGCPLKHRQPKKNILHYGSTLLKVDFHKTFLENIDIFPRLFWLYGLVLGPMLQSAAVGLHCIMSVGLLPMQARILCQGWYPWCRKRMGETRQTKGGLCQTTANFVIHMANFHRHGILIYIYTYDVCHVL